MLLGFDIGGTKCSIVLGEKNVDGVIQVAGKVVLPTKGSAAEMIESIITAAETLMEQNRVKKIELGGIGISCGGPLDNENGIILSPPNLPGWDNIRIVELLEKRFGIKAILQNDANACAVAEWKFGAGIGFRDIIFLTFGTGLGAGVILNGRLYSGANGFAGEVGHIRLSDSGPVGFGKSGSFEGFCSGGGIAQLARQKATALFQDGEDCAFCKNSGELSLITAKSVADAAYLGDQAAADIYKICGFYLGKGLSILIDILNPQVIILGSIYCRAQSLIEPAMREVIMQEALPVARDACMIVPASLAENIGDIAALAIADMAGSISS